MQKVAWPTTMVQKLNGMSSSPSALRRLIPVMMPGRAMGRINSSEMASRPKKRERHTAAAASVPSTMAVNVETVATWSESHSASRMSWRCMAIANHFVVSPGGGNTKVFASVLKAYRTMNASGTCRKAIATTAAARSGHPALGDVLERIEGPQPARDTQVTDHDDDRNHGQRGGHRNIAGRALMTVHRLPDERLGGPDDRRNDVVAQREREREDRPCNDAG